MSTHVELQLFPCLENPQWTLTPDEAVTYKRWEDEASRLAAPSAGERFVDPSVLPRVGYTGFRVTIGAEPGVQIYNSQVVNARARAAVPPGFETIEQFLFWTYRVELYEEYGLEVDVIRDQPPTRIKDLPDTCPLTTLNCGLADFPDLGSMWNCMPYLTEDACYNYANNILTQRRLYPGDADRVFNVAEMRTRLRGDGLMPVARIPDLCPTDPASHFIAALLHDSATSGSFHFLRLDRNGLWTHKNGHYPATNRAENGLISDLCRAEFKTKFRFAGFFEATAEARTLLERRGRPATVCRP